MLYEPPAQFSGLQTTPEVECFIGAEFRKKTLVKGTLRCENRGQ